MASTQELYGADLARVDFQQASEDARKEINEWVKGLTEGERLGRCFPLSTFPTCVSILAHSQAPASWPIHMDVEQEPQCVCIVISAVAVGVTQLSQVRSAFKGRLRMELGSQKNHPSLH